MNDEQVDMLLDSLQRIAQALEDLAINRREAKDEPAESIPIVVRAIEHIAMCQRE